MLKPFIAVISLMLFLHSSSSFSCAELPSFLIPKTTSSIVDLCRSEYEVGYSMDLKSPLWVGETLTAKEVAKEEARKNMFHADPFLPKGKRAELSDFAKSAYDRGHLFSAGDASTDLGMKESFYLSNMIPQDKTNNRGIWKELEEKVRTYATKERSLQIFSGPIFASNPKTIGKNKIPVPTELFKVIYDGSKNESLTLIIPNKPETSLAPFISNLQTLKDKTGIEFLIDQKPQELNSLPF